MQLHSIINSFGLVADIIGAILLFKYGLPEEVRRSGLGFLEVTPPDREEIKKARKYDFWGKFGLLFLIVGFVLQFLSNFITN